MTIIMGIRLDNRIETALEFQKTLTKFGCIIKTRLGLHDVAADKCAPNGIVLLEVIDDVEGKVFEAVLSKIEGIEVHVMNFK